MIAEDIDIDLRCFLEHSRLPSKVNGSFFGKDRVESPFAGITGTGKEYLSKEKSSAWIHGEIISPLYIDNGGCACRSHIEGIADDNGNLHLLEQVYDFMAREGDCYEYLLNVKDKVKVPLQFEGKVVARINRNNFKPVEIGEATLELNPFWVIGESGVSRSHSLRYNDRSVMRSGVYIPHFWEDFLKQIEETGYKHPYAPLKNSKKE